MIHAMKATAALIGSLELLSDDNNFGNFRLEKFQLKQYMRLDQAAIEALHLLPAKGESNFQLEISTSILLILFSTGNFSS